MGISIVAWGGIGDTLRNLYITPHRFLFHTFGIRCGVVWVDWQKGPHLQHAPGADGRMIEEFVSRCPSLRWQGEVAQHRGTGRLFNRAIRDISKVLNGNQSRYYPFELRLTEARKSRFARFACFSSRKR